MCSRLISCLPITTDVFMHVSRHAKLLQSCLTLCNAMDCSPPGSSVHGIFQARMLEQVAEPSCRGSSQSRDGTHVSMSTCLARWVLYHQRHLGSLCVMHVHANTRVCEHTYKLMPATWALLSPDAVGFLPSPCFCSLVLSAYSTL